MVGLPLLEIFVYGKIISAQLLITPIVVFRY